MSPAEGSREFAKTGSHLTVSAGNISLLSSGSNNTVLTGGSFSSIRASHNVAALLADG